MPKFVNCGVASVATIMMFVSSGASAQEFPPVIDSSWMMGMAMGSAMSEAAGGSAEYIGQSANTSPTRARDRSTVSLNFEPSQRRRAQNLAQFTSTARRSSPQTATAMRQLFASTDIIAAVGKSMKSVGLNPNSVGDAYAVWWATSWFAAKGRESQLDRATASSISGQAAQAFGSIAEFDALSNAEKQEMAEALMVQAAIIDAANDAYRNDPKMLRTLQSSVAAGAQKMGTDLTAMDLTEDGFVMRDGASAADRPAVPGGKAPAALAAARTEAGERGGESGAGGSDLSDYALPALGGTAALAAVFLLGRAAGRRG